MPSLSDRRAAVRPTEDDDAGLDWRRVLRDAIRDPAELCRELGLPESLASHAAHRGFQTLAPRGFVARMNPGDPRDPLLAQVLPQFAETAPDGRPTDAVGDLAAGAAPGMIHKYHGRVLLVAAGRCAVNCRYCFRRHYPYDRAPTTDAAWSPAVDAIASDPSVHEVILSGGDPLVLGDARLERLVDRLAAIPHLHTLRIHTRLPIVVPERVTERLCCLLAETRLTAVVVLHTNHANEIDRTVMHAVSRLRRVGSLLLNQAVLLKGVNDSVAALEGLSRRLVAAGVTPYYLHQLDMVAGVGGFEVPVEEGLRLVGELRKRLPGYAIPRYVREEPGAPSKTVLA